MAASTAVSAAEASNRAVESMESRRRHSTLVAGPYRGSKPRHLGARRLASHHLSRDMPSYASWPFAGMHGGQGAMIQHQTAVAREQSKQAGARHHQSSPAIVSVIASSSSSSYASSSPLALDGPHRPCQQFVHDESCRPDVALAVVQHHSWAGLLVHLWRKVGNGSADAHVPVLVAP